MAAGQPTKYDPAYNIQVEKLCKLGATDAELADFFNVTETTINNWKKAEPQFFESIKRGKLVADAEVADKLFQRASGYEHPETKFFTINVGDFQQQIETRETIKIYPPDTAAAIFWLKNRQPTKWRDKTDQDINVGITDVIMPKPIEDENT